MKLEASASLLPGTYHLPTNEPYSRVVAALEAGPVLVVEPLLVPEGYTIHQMAAALGRLRGIGVSPGAFVTAATGGQVRSPYAGRDQQPGGPALPGYVPGTPR